MQIITDGLRINDFQSKYPSKTTKKWKVEQKKYCSWIRVHGRSESFGPRISISILLVLRFDCCVRGVELEDSIISCGSRDGFVLSLTFVSDAASCSFESITAVVSRGSKKIQIKLTFSFSSRLR
jgi:hypothetical protein